MLFPPSQSTRKCASDPTSFSLAKTGDLQEKAGGLHAHAIEWYEDAASKTNNAAHKNVFLLQKADVRIQAAEWITCFIPSRSTYKEICQLRIAALVTYEDSYELYSFQCREFINTLKEKHYSFKNERVQHRPMIE